MEADRKVYSFFFVFVGGDSRLSPSIDPVEDSLAQSQHPRQAGDAARETTSAGAMSGKPACVHTRSGWHVTRLCWARRAFEQHFLLDLCNRMLAQSKS